MNLLYKRRIKRGFEEERNVKGEEAPLYRFITSGSKYLDENAMAKRVKETEYKLIRLKKK